MNAWLHLDIFIMHGTFSVFFVAFQTKFRVSVAETVKICRKFKHCIHFFAADEL